MYGNEFRERLQRDTEALDAAGLLKRERVIGTAQGPVIKLKDGQEMINLCANNYLGLANHPAVLEAAHEGLTRFGYGMASVRFICGTQSVHRDLEERLSAYLSMDDTILYSSCFDANGGLFETLLDEQDAVISDALNHASIIDGIRLCKARRMRYANNDMNELEQALDTVVRGEIYVSAAVANKTVFQQAREAEKRRLLKSLTPRQCEVVQLLAEGKSMKEVADVLRVTPRTVAFHKYRTMEELALKSTAELIQFAIKNHIVVA